ncbi:hypothetical protein CLOM_g5040 [Closterium sp. NIES-68]|nr:hypothetical protein CLOM_g5040 [Closterium sp. NIES-68]GJP67778.1 hypothetical protein CLOP_g24549 [Closterium sp. NIES-67]GJP70047.1 hypothetical protein CLOP_g1039 [Closterium sp. NIES-67]
MLTLVDDYGDRKAGNLLFTPDQRVSLFFEPFRNLCYPHLRNRYLAVLIRSPTQGNLGGWINRRTVPLEYDSDQDSRLVHGDADSRDSGGVLSEPNGEDSGDVDSGDSGNSIGGPSAANGRDSPREARLIDQIRQPLTEALDLVHERIDRCALMGEGGAGGGVEKVKLLVRLGKLLFSVQGRPEASLSRIPSFSAQKLEDHLNNRARFRVPIHRTYETHVPDSIYSRLEDLLMRDAGSACQAASPSASSEKYNIQVIDTKKGIIDKAVCKYLTDERRFLLKKVKLLPLQYAVIDIANPGKAVDARLFLTTETHLTELDGDLDTEIQKILEFAQIDPWNAGGLHIPPHMTEGYQAPDASTNGHGASSGACEGSSNCNGAKKNHRESRRFQIRAVRHVTVRQAAGGGRLWKFSRVDGIEYKQEGGRRTNEIELCPVAWQHDLKTSRVGGGGSIEQQAPAWSTEEIMAECPGLLAWLTDNLPS